MSQEQAQHTEPGEQLTPRENEVAVLLAEGLGSSEIAARLSLAPSSVKWYRRRIFHKLGVHTRYDAALRLRQMALQASPIASTDGSPDHSGNAPRPLTSFVGRRREMDELLTWLDSGRSRLLTITGTAGSGKSRLALAFAAEAGPLLDHGGPYWVDRAATSDARLVSPTIASALALFIKPVQSAVSAIVDHLGSMRALLVLDNCEQIATECAKISLELLGLCPGLRIVATSRIPLPAKARNFQLDPLPVPAAEDLALDEIAACESVRLFTERAALVIPGFTATRENAAALVRVCRRLDGLPLAIELAASRVKVLTTWQLDERLERALGLLTGGGAAAERRHATLRAALDWSHGLLTVAEQTLLRRLSVFAGGWSVEDAESVCAGGDLQRDDVLGTLADLVDQSLVVVERPVDGARRFRLLEVIRQYSDDKLRSSGERSVVRAYHADRFAALAREAQTELTGPRQPEWTVRLEQDRGNLRAALDWCLSVPERLESGAQMACSLAQMWQLRGEFAEGLMWLRKYLAAGHVMPGRARAELSDATGFLALHAGLADEARQHWERAAEIFGAMGDSAAVGRQLHYLAHVTMETDPQRAALLAAQGLTLERQAEDRWWTSACLFALGDASFLLGDVEKAAECYAESQVLARQLGHLFAIARRCVRLGQVARVRGDLVLAGRHLTEAVKLARDGNDDWGITMALAAWASLAASLGMPQTSAKLLGSSQTRLDRFGAVLWALDRIQSAITEATAKALLGEEGFLESVEAGRSMTQQAAETLISELQQPLQPAAAGKAKVFTATPLTPREAQVLHLLAGGESNRDIALDLGLSVRTVERHTANLYAKIGVEGSAARAAAANYAFRHGLGPEQDALATGHESLPPKSPPPNH
jgi:non-specific serine/threonine protein kinase